MNVLALETATDFAGIAVVSEEATEFIISNPREKGNMLAVFIKRALQDVHLELKGIDLLAVGIGPGLYTGVRIGLSIMKGLSIAAQKPLVGISTLDTIAYNFLGKREKIATLLNAYGGEVYGAVYDVGGDFKRCGNYFVGEIQDFIKRIKGKVIFTGTGVKIYQKKIEGALGTRAVFAREEFWIPRPASLARLAIERFKRGRLLQPDRILPLYLKKSEAERRWKRLHSRR